MPLPADAHIGAVSLTVTDLKRSLPFYQDVLGFRVISREGLAAFLSAADDRVLVELHERRDAVPRGYHHHLGLNTWAGGGAPPPPERVVVALIGG